MLIYQAKNKINGKIYIGQTVGNLNSRKAAHLSNAKAGRYDSYFYKTIRKYGSENFIWEVLEECENREELNEREEYWIKKLNTLAPSGYNLESGGKNFSVHEETRMKMREANKGENNPFYGKKHTEDTLKKMREARLGKKRKPFSEEWCENMRKNRADTRGENNSCAKLIEADVIDIRRMAKNGMKQREIARIKNISISNVGNIINYKL